MFERNFSLSRDFERDHVARGQRDRVHVDRKVRRRHDRRVARPHHRQAHVAEAFLRAEADDHFLVGVEPHAELLEVLRRHFAAQVGDAVRLAVAVVARVAGRLGQLLDDELLAADRTGLPMPRSITSSPARRLL